MIDDAYSWSILMELIPMKKLVLLAPAIATSLTLAVPALAHPKLLSSTPASAATVSAPRQVAMTFSEPLMAAMSGAQVVMTGVP